jgi:hypothetical protein
VPMKKGEGRADETQAFSIPGSGSASVLSDAFPKGRRGARHAECANPSFSTGALRGTSEGWGGNRTSILTWHTILAGHCRNGRIEVALEDQDHDGS